jgi:hypothetical protein
MCPDEIYLASFPFGGSAGMKLRPVLLLTIHARNVVRRLGVLSAGVATEVDEKLRTLLQL